MTQGERAGDGRPFAVRGRLAVDGSLVPGAVVVEGATIVAVHKGTMADGDLPSDVREVSIVAPGLIDLQVNGGFGVEVGTSAEALRHLSARLPSTGVTGFLPTIVSSPLELYPRAFQAFDQARDATGAAPFGFHLEGPFLSPEKAGAHRMKTIREASEQLLDVWLAAGSVGLVTLAPEREGAGQRIARLRDRGIVVSLGHTNASYDEFRQGVDHGATMATHLFSAMSAFQHRAPGAVGAALLDDRLTAGLIVDGVHCHPASVRLAIRAKGAERIALVTDAIAGAGVGPGVYQIDGQDIVVDATCARLPNGTLAGSVLTLDQAVRNAVSMGEVSPSAALRMASEVPARVLGLRGKGRLVRGGDADLVLLDEDLAVVATYGRGRLLFQRAGGARPASHTRQPNRA